MSGNEASADEPASNVPILPQRIGPPHNPADPALSDRLISSLPAMTIPDLNNDARITDSDLIAWVETVLAPDLVVDDIDGDKFLSAIDEVAALRDRLAPEADESQIMALVRVLVAIDGTLTQSRYTRGHLGTISRGWGAAMHNSATSGFRNKRDRKRFPANHVASISQSWPGTHGVTTSRVWPPQHDAETSASWGTMGKGSHEHHTAISIAWPARHTRGSSLLWSTHTLIVSERSPPNHAQKLSYRGKPIHNSEMSSTWIHAGSEPPVGWPANHLHALSATWLAHAEDLSASWPTMHHGAVSAHWPTTDEYNRVNHASWWRANHDTTISHRYLLPAADSGACD